ncbi:hypothetical protein BGZ59_008801 [Podila verticillata]|nr:hypothetical protein BGZ59_008801 [Podila verticillata]
MSPSNCLKEYIAFHSKRLIGQGPSPPSKEVEGLELLPYATMIAILVLALVSVAMAAPTSAPVADAALSGDSKCSISGFKPSFSKINECCLKNMGGSDFDKKKNVLKCRLPIGREGPMRKCVKDLGFATVVNCDY